MNCVVRILFVDAFDSFTNNIVGLLEQTLGAKVTVVRIDDESAANNLGHLLAYFDAVVVGPGPGHPGIPSDVGFVSALWDLPSSQQLPVLGICLGFQSLCLSQGAKVKRLRRARHGIVTPVTHNGADIFAGVGHIAATQYHSLHVDLGGPPGESLFWAPTAKCPTLQPLAWDTSDQMNGTLLLGVRHVEKPFWGVQFHPESICTSKSGADLIATWWTAAQEWSLMRGRRVLAERVDGAIRSVRPVFEDSVDQTFQVRSAGHDLSKLLRSVIGPGDPFLRWARHPAASISPTALCEALGCNRRDLVLLDSQGHASGRFSILGLVIPDKTMKVTYRVTDKTLRYGFGAGETASVKLDSIDRVWPILQEALDLHNPRSHHASSNTHRTGMDHFVEGRLPAESSFWGGFMGYISYEAGLETIQVDLHQSCSTGDIPDINLAFIHRSIVIDHVAGQTYVQSLLPDDWAWILDVGRVIEGLVGQSSTRVRSPLADAAKMLQQAATGLDEAAELERSLRQAHVARPEEASYRAKVLKCQEFLASGDSYELCLTDESLVTVPENLDPWSLYKKVRRKNPAPFGTFLRLPGATVIGSSPERFLQWTRGGRCQFRPIKGTVKKGPDMSRERAHAILNSSKERAENLMIVDLIRHDLSGVVGAENCTVPKLMVVEEYETVYQLVSVIEGQLPEVAGPNGPRGIDVLKASLPPGSMTGAPKKRSCEILRDIEQRPRGVYSGVLGYMDVGGGGDFSVVIRTAVRGSSGIVGAGGDVTAIKHCSSPAAWRVGAGGAVTIQSTDEGEFLEMEVKASSVLRALLPEKV